MSPEPSALVQISPAFYTLISGAALSEYKGLKLFDTVLTTLTTPATHSYAALLCRFPFFPLGVEYKEHSAISRATHLSMLDGLLLCQYSLVAD